MTKNRQQWNSGAVSIIGFWSDEDLHSYTPSTAEMYLITPDRKGSDPVWCGDWLELQAMMEKALQLLDSGKTVDEVEDYFTEISLNELDPIDWDRHVEEGSCD